MKITIDDELVQLVGPWDYADMVILLRSLDTYSDPAIKEIMHDVRRAPRPERIKLGTLLLSVARRVPELCGYDLEEIIKAWLAYDAEETERSAEAAKN